MVVPAPDGQIDPPPSRSAMAHRACGDAGQRRPAIQCLAWGFASHSAGFGKSWGAHGAGVARDPWTNGSDRCRHSRRLTHPYRAGVSVAWTFAVGNWPGPRWWILVRGASPSRLSTGASVPRRSLVHRVCTGRHLADIAPAGRASRAACRCRHRKRSRAMTAKGSRTRVTFVRPHASRTS